MNILPEEYEDFKGILIQKRNMWFRNATMLTLRSESKSIQVVCGKGGADGLSIGQSIELGHIGKQIINIRPDFKKAFNRETYHCPLYGRQIAQAECRDVQSIRRKPMECEHIDFDLAKADEYCPSCEYNQCM